MIFNRCTDLAEKYAEMRDLKGLLLTAFACSSKHRRNKLIKLKSQISAERFNNTTERRVNQENQSQVVEEENISPSPAVNQTSLITPI